MSEPGATARRRRSRRAAPQPSRVRRPLIAIASVILVITPISWILLHQPQSDQADASVPYVTRDDDTYITASTDPVVDTTDAPPTAVPSTPPTPGKTPSTPGVTPPLTPGQTPGTPGTADPTTTPTDGPTGEPTDPPTSGTTTAPPPSSETQNPRPTKTPTRTPTDDPTPSTPPPNNDDGNMSGAEVELFSLVDNARQDRGCAPLQRNSSLSNGAGSDADTRARNGQVSDGGNSYAATGGDGMSAKSAFDKLKSERGGTIFNCGLDELGVGRGDSTREEGGALCDLLDVGCTERTRVAWVVDFD
ncbi:hypothetical protein [Kribbella italica]|uniref:SCP domain-containing protein n=1 Tax=Kribbella italica TaxID=1540520 RepID=A0A7W9JF31_9ACTN|nr:hypothetical protein [Kribbella italica]MBB5840785.1 hypothetical protein [Kribbella italica]